MTYKRLTQWLDAAVFTVEGADATHVVTRFALLVGVVVFVITAALKRALRSYFSPSKPKRVKARAPPRRGMSLDEQRSQLKKGLADLTAEAEALLAKKQRTDAGEARPVASNARPAAGGSSVAAPLPPKKSSPRKKRTKKAQD